MDCGGATRGGDRHGGAGRGRQERVVSRTRRLSGRTGLKWRPVPPRQAEPEELRASPQATRQDKKRIKELERELLRKDRALAETAALLVLSKKVAAIFNKGEDE
jgi:hypothetical protein